MQLIIHFHIAEEEHFIDDNFRVCMETNFSVTGY